MAVARRTLDKLSGVSLSACATFTLCFRVDFLEFVNSLWILIEQPQQIADRQAYGWCTECMRPTHTECCSGRSGSIP